MERGNLSRMSIFKRKTETKPQPDKKATHFTTHFQQPEGGNAMNIAFDHAFKKPNAPLDRNGKAVAMDSGFGAIKNEFANSGGVIPDNLAYWYGTQSFIGYQLCALFAQNWLVDKACTMPARDAVRVGFEMSVPKGVEVDPDKIAALKEMNEKMKLGDKLVEFVRFGRIFGIRLALFEVDLGDQAQQDDYYFNPFNIDGVKPGTYKGICQIDPYWVTPELDFSAASNPAALNFYEPTWWRVNGKRIHRSHFIIMRTSEVADILKPAYFYGGIPIPQKIYERVYAAERTANEAPLLALTKRTTVIKTDLSLAAANETKFKDSLSNFVYNRDNYAVKIIGDADEFSESDTSLADLDAVIMTQYQIVAAAANVPATKLLGTTPKGFNSTGEYEEASYHEELESLQRHDLTAFVNRHHELCIKSDISPGNPFTVEISWNPLDVPTEKELAEINQIKATIGQTLGSSGAIDGMDERQRITLDKNSGYANLPAIDRDVDEIETNEENDDGDGNDKSGSANKE